MYTKRLVGKPEGKRLLERLWEGSKIKLGSNLIKKKIR
jgi:hypothetical protein